jgi:hypothetical protein
MDAVAQATESYGATVLPLGGPSPLPRAPVSTSMEEFISDYARNNWRARDGLNAYRAQIMRERVARTPEDFERNAVYQEGLRPLGVRWFASAKVGQAALSLGIFRTREQGPLTTQELDKVRELSLALAAR